LSYEHERVVRGLIPFAISFSFPSCFPVSDGRAGGGNTCAIEIVSSEWVYGFYLARNPASQKIWLRRHDTEESKKLVRNEFTIRKLFDAVKACDKNEAKVVEQLYEQCIDDGAHPSQRALTQRLEKQATEDNVKFQLIYMTDDPVVFRLCLRIAAQVGASVLGIFRLVFKERFDISGLTEQLDEVKKGLFERPAYA
jgi:hypothetical protein